MGLSDSIDPNLESHFIYFSFITDTQISSREKVCTNHQAILPLMVQISDLLFHKRIQALEIKIEISILFDHIVNSANRETRKILSFFFFLP